MCSYPFNECFITVAIDMKQLMIVIIVIIIVLMDSAEGQYSNCNDSCPTGKYVIITCFTEGILGKRIFVSYIAI